MLGRYSVRPFKTYSVNEIVALQTKYGERWLSRVAAVHDDDTYDFLVFNHLYEWPQHVTKIPYNASEGKLYERVDSSPIARVEGRTVLAPHTQVIANYVNETKSFWFRGIVINKTGKSYTIQYEEDDYDGNILDNVSFQSVRSYSWAR
jgi:hypothetical protein